MKYVKKVKNVLVVLVSVFFLPLVYFVGEWYYIRWLRIVSAVLVIPVMIWWGTYGYNWVFGKKKNENQNEIETGNENLV